MAENSQRDFLWLAKKVGPHILIFLIIFGMLLLGGGMSVGAFAFKAENTQPQADTPKLFRPGDASDQCIQQALIKAASDGAAAWANLRGKSTANSVDELPAFRAAAAKYGIPLALSLAIGKNESGFDPKRTSPAGAKGVMQIMPGTFTNLAPKGADPYDAKTSIDAGSKYLGNIYKRYGGNIRLTAAGYNAGPDDPYIKNHKVPPYPETQNYVQNVLAVYNEIAKCSSLPNRPGSSGQKIAAEAIKHIGKPGTDYNADGSNACAAFVVDVIKTATNSTQNLTSTVPDNWAGASVLSSGQLGESMGVKGSRLLIDNKFALGGTNDQKISLADIQPGDYIFFADAGTKLGYNNPHHSGIYVGDYTDPKTGKTTTHAVVTLSSSANNGNGEIVVDQLENFPSGWSINVIGVRRF